MLLCDSSYMSCVARYNELNFDNTELFDNVKLSLQMSRKQLAQIAAEVHNCWKKSKGKFKYLYSNSNSVL